MPSQTILNPGDTLICRRQDGYRKRYASVVKPGDVVIFVAPRNGESFYGHRFGENGSTKLKVWRYDNFSPYSVHTAQEPNPGPCKFQAEALWRGLDDFFAIYEDVGAARLLMQPIANALGVDITFDVSFKLTRMKTETDHDN